MILYEENAFYKKGKHRNVEIKPVPVMISLRAKITIVYIKKGTGLHVRFLI